MHKYSSTGTSPAVVTTNQYCDRWCETCPFTVRCAVYVMGNLEEMVRLNTPEAGDNMFDQNNQYNQCDGCGSFEPAEDEWDETDTVETDFPAARAFVRPGFDTAEDAEAKSRNR